MLPLSLPWRSPDLALIRSSQDSQPEIKRLLLVWGRMMLWVVSCFEWLVINAAVVQVQRQSSQNTDPV